eukprot:1296084-Lingulodinium_polyedra.AAC.1
MVPCKPSSLDNRHKSQLFGGASGCTAHTCSGNGRTARAPQSNPWPTRRTPSRNRGVCRGR